MSARRLFLPAGCVLAALLLPPPAAPKAQHAPEQRTHATISVSVVEIGSGRPISDARVRAYLHGQGQREYLASTDSEGKCRVTRLPAGWYSVDVFAPGYLRTRIWQPWSGTAPSPIRMTGTHAESDGASVSVEVTSGRNVSITYRLARGGIIGGHVVDSEGRPVSEAQVNLLRVVPARANYPRSYRVYESAGRQPVGADGSFRFDGLLAGPHYVRVSPGRDDDWPVQSDVYYPETQIPDEAQPVLVEEGEELQFLVKTPRFPLLSISGRVRGVMPRRSRLEMTMQRLGESHGDSIAMWEVPVRPDGSFKLPELTGGVYGLVAEARSASEVVAAGTAIVKVGSADVQDVTVKLEKPASLEGIVVASSAEGSLQGRIHFNLSVTGPDSNLIYQNLRGGGYIPSGLFRISGIYGTFRATIRVPPGWFAEAMLLEDGTNILDVPFTFEAGKDYRNVRIILTDRAAAIEGVSPVGSNGDGSHRLVVVFPEDPSKWDLDSRFVRRVGIDAAGRFRVDNLQVGATYLVALHARTMHESDEAILKAASGSAVRLYVDRPGTYRVNLLPKR